MVRFRSSTNRSVLGFFGMLCTALSVSLALYLRGTLAPRICRLSGEHCGQLVEALLHTGTGQVACVLSRVAVLGNGHMCLTLP